MLHGLELDLSLVSGLGDPGQLLLGVCRPGLQLRQRCSGALLLVEVVSASASCSRLEEESQMLKARSHPNTATPANIRDAGRVSSAR